jgi:hypothetical protein
MSSALHHQRETPVIYAKRRVLARARQLLGEDVCLENEVARAIARGDAEMTELGGEVWGPTWRAEVWARLSFHRTRLAWVITKLEAKEAIPWRE